ncbi:pisatin demethylase, partial [Fusarium albosuccineum]
MQEFAASGEVIDLAKWAQMYAFDVIGQLFFSQMFGFMKDRHDYGNYIKSLDTLLPILTAASVVPTYLRTPFFLGGAVVPGIFKALKSVKAIEIAAEHCVRQRQQLVGNGIAGDKNDILEDLFDIWANKGEKVDFGLTEIKVEVYVALFAG